MVPAMASMAPVSAVMMSVMFMMIMVIAIMMVIVMMVVPIIIIPTIMIMAAAAGAKNKKSKNGVFFHWLLLFSPRYRKSNCLCISFLKRSAEVESDQVFIAFLMSE